MGVLFTIATTSYNDIAQLNTQNSCCQDTGTKNENEAPSVDCVSTVRGVWMCYAVLYEAGIDCLSWSRMLQVCGCVFVSGLLVLGSRFDRTFFLFAARYAPCWLL